MKTRDSAPRTRTPTISGTRKPLRNKRAGPNSKTCSDGLAKCTGAGCEQMLEQGTQAHGSTKAPSGLVNARETDTC